MCSSRCPNSYVFAVLIALLLDMAASAQQLIFTEYVEGSGFNKALEVLNLAPNSIDLTTAQIEIYANGSLSPTAIIPLSGLLIASDVWVVANPSAVMDVLDVADQTSSSVNFNGDDAVVLRVSGEIVDAIGRIGEDPGSSWDGSGVSTQDRTLRRRHHDCAIDHGNVAFDPSVDWNAFAQDEFGDLGYSDGAFALENCNAAPVPSIHPIALYTLVPGLLVGVGLVAMRRLR